MIRKIIVSSILTFSFALLCFAADITGRWDGKVSTPNGDMKVSYNLKAEGDKLTGTVTSDNGVIPISEGKVNGNELSFKIAVNDFVIPHEGKVSGDSLKLKIQIQGQTVENIFIRAVVK